MGKRVRAKDKNRTKWKEICLDSLYLNIVCTRNVDFFVPLTFDMNDQVTGSDFSAVNNYRTTLLYRMCTRGEVRCNRRD